MSAEINTVYNVWCADCAEGYGPFDYADDAEYSASVHDEENHEVTE